MEERDIQMEDPFAFLTLNFLKKSGDLSRLHRHLPLPFQRTGKVNDGSIQAWVYENICFEKPGRSRRRPFPGRRRAWRPCGRG